MLINIYACTHHPSVCPWARALHVYIKVNRTNCLCVICDMSSDCCLPFLLCLVFLSLRCVSHMTDIHNSMLRVVYLRTWSCVVCVCQACTLCIPSCRTCLIVNVLAFYTNADLIARLLRERLCCVLFIISFLFLSYIIIYIYIRYEHEIITQQVYIFAFCSIDGSASIANRHRTVHDEGPQRTISPCPLSASIITCLKCANDPTPTPCVCLYPISEEIETHREDHTPTRPIPSSTSSV